MMNESDYRIYAHGKYMELFQELEYRAFRAARMNYSVSSNYDWYCWWLEFFSATFGFISIGSVMTWLAKFNAGFRITLTTVVIAVVLDFIARGSIGVLPSLSERAMGHTNAGAAWQTLQMKIASIRIETENSDLDVARYPKLYEELIQKREEICKTVVIPESFYTDFHNATRKFQEYLKERADIAHLIAGPHDGEKGIEPSQREARKEVTDAPSHCEKGKEVCGFN